MGGFREHLAAQAGPPGIRDSLATSPARGIREALVKSRRGSMDKSGGGWESSGSKETGNVTHVLHHSSGARAVVRPGYGSEHDLYVYHPSGSMAHRSTHDSLGQAKAEGERHVGMFRKSEGGDSEYKNPDGTFKGGFDGAVRYFEHKGYSHESATKIAGKIAAEKGK